MTRTFGPIAPLRTDCKCCGAPAPICGVVDFNKNCEQRRKPDTLAPSGIPVYYHRCERCGFLFTVAFDRFTAADFAQWIYNDEYIRVDPDYLEARPTINADLVQNFFGGSKDIRVLDYGAGNGSLATQLRRRGFTCVDSYDPFVPEHSRRPEGRYDLVLSFEVVEHSPDPKSTFVEIDSFVEPRGLVLFSTMLQPAGPSNGLDWWYVAPRNGHVSIHSRDSLLRLVEPLGYTHGSSNESLHVLFKQLPSFASHLLSKAA